MIDIVNDFDQVIWVCEKKELYKQKHTHRVVHIFVFNSENKLALQLRSKKESFMPLHWFGSVGWHIISGEHHEEWAKREMQEELWINPPLKFIGKQFYSDQYGNWIKKFQFIYETKYDWEFTIDENEIDSIKFFSLDEIKNMVIKWEKFNQELLDLLKKFYELGI